MRLSTVFQKGCLTILQAHVRGLNLCVELKFTPSQSIFYKVPNRCRITADIRSRVIVRSVRPPEKKGIMRHLHALKVIIYVLYMALHRLKVV